MRVNLVDGAIFGIGISGIILVIRWFFSDSHVLEQITVIGVGAVILFAIKITLDQWRIRRTQSAESPDPPSEAELPPEQPAPLVTLPSPWIAEPETVEASMPAGGDPAHSGNGVEDPAKAGEDPAPPENGAAEPTNELVGAVALRPEPDDTPDSTSRSDDSPEKMV
jgi:hypothetical protein